MTMLGKINRLQKDKEFRKIFKQSRPISAGNLVFRVMRQPNSVSTRFGFVISNKIDKRSTKRNALKRRLRSIARELILKIKSGYDIIVIVRRNYPFPYDYAKIRADFERGTRESGLA